MTSGKPSNIVQCCSCNENQDKVRGCKCVKAHKPCIHCGTQNCGNRLANHVYLPGLNTFGSNFATYNGAQLDPTQIYDELSVECALYRTSSSDSPKAHMINGVQRHNATHNGPTRALNDFEDMTDEMFDEELSFIYELACTNSRSLKDAVVMCQLVLQRYSKSNK
ncbi:hypothetical protein GJ496_002644 [Pomphorhynchus laevis]|nr:hypothetical protein GJ496_002644 [Pomphorhynchus laevis]